MPAKGDDESAALWRMSGLGFEFLSAVLALGAVGYGTDYLLGSKPFGVIVGIACGFVVGLWRLVKVSKQSAKDSKKD